MDEGGGEGLQGQLIVRASNRPPQILVSEENRFRCDSPLSGQEILKIVNSAIKMEEGGTLSSEELGLLPILNLAEGMGEERKPPEMLLTGLLYKARLHCWFGDSSVGKTWIALWVCQQDIRTVTQRDPCRSL